MKSTPAPLAPTARLVSWIVFATTLIAVLCARIHLAGLPLERDEGEYAYMGQLLLQGVPPYKLAYSMKFPGTAAAYAVLMSTFGHTPTGVHLALLFTNLITVALIVLLGWRLTGEVGGVAAGATYSVLSLMPHVLGQAAHATHFVVLFAIAGALVLIRGLDRRSAALIFGSGCLFGIAFLMKQSGAFFVLFGSIYLSARDWREQLSTKTTLARNLLFLCGAGVPCFLTLLAVWGFGIFGKFWFWTIQYAAHYGTEVSLSEAAAIFAAHIRGTLGTAWPIWAAGFVGLIACLVSSAIRNHALILLLFAGFSAASVCPGFYFRPHYFIAFLPALALLTAAGVIAGVEFCKVRAPNFRWAPIVILAMCLFWPLWSERDFFFQKSLAEANRMVNGTNPFPESLKIGEYLHAQTAPSDTIAVLGSEPQIYFYAKRHSATGYIYTYGLMEPQRYAHQMQQEMIAEIEAARPKFVVLVVEAKSWLVRGDSDQTIFRWAARYCEANYDEVGLVNIFDEGTDYYLSDPPSNVTSASGHIVIYRRKT